MVNKSYQKRCKKCKSDEIKKDGFMRGKQRYKCKCFREYLTSLNIGTRADKEGKNKISKNFFHYSFIHKILTNEAYIGKYYFLKTKSINENGKTKEVKRDKSEWLSFECDKIIDEKTFRQAQEKLKKGKALNGRGETHLFTGLLKCEVCGRSYVYYKSKKDTGNYRCNGRHTAKVGNDILCTNTQVSETKLLNAVWKEIIKIFENPNKFLEEYVKLQKDQTQEINDLKKELLSIEEEIIKKDKVIKNGLRKQLEDEANYDNYEDIIGDITKEKKTLKERQSIIENKLEGLKSIDEVKAIIQELSKIYNAKFGKLDNGEKEVFIKELINSVVIGEKNYKMLYRFALK